MSTSPRPSKYTPEQNEQYFAVRLGNYHLRHSRGLQYRSRCPLHDGSNPTALLVDFSDGHTYCFSCDSARGGKGRSDIYFFEQAMLWQELNRSPMHDEVVASLEKILGEPITQRVYKRPLSEVKQGGWDRSQARARYRYDDEVGEEVTTVHRFVWADGTKKTPPDRPCPFCRTHQNLDAECPYKCEDGRIWGTTAREDGLEAARRVLYHLPDVLQSALVVVTEGEKNADDLNRALSLYINEKGAFPFGALLLDRVAVTTNIGGCGAWKPEYQYQRYLWKKTAIVLRDADAQGLKHQQDVCSDIGRYARETYTLDLPGMEDGEDISDFLARNSIEDFLALLPTRKLYEVPKPKDVVHLKEDVPRQLLVKPSALVKPGESGKRDWLVPSFIARGTRGLVIAAPKTGKSLLFCDLAIALAANQSFLGARPYGRPVRTAIISREDPAPELYLRLQALGKGRGLDWREIDRNLRVNTTDQSLQFSIDNPKHLEEMAGWLKAEEIEFATIDVLGKLHSGEENSADSMNKVMHQFDELARQSGSMVCVIHHASKDNTARGSTAIAGWADWIVRLAADPQDGHVKELTLQTKSSAAMAPRHIRYYQSDDESESRIELLTAAGPAVVKPFTHQRSRHVA